MPINIPIAHRWLSSDALKQPTDVEAIAEQAIRCGAKENMHRVNEATSKEKYLSDEDKLQNVIKVTQLIRSDLQRGIEFYDKLFFE